ncbi:MAG: TIR domain-containing protein, partial [Euryarchaeota archaeon]|nr:TIR domain-containing protein [Euryarchaeota archaeon]
MKPKFPGGDNPKRHPMKDFFISYTQADRTWAEWIAWQLEEAGYTTVLQAWDFRPRSNFVLKMDRAAKEAERTIPVLSPDYFVSWYAPSEWAAAFKEDPTGEMGLILPVRVRDCDPEGLLGSIVYIDLTDMDEDPARDRLLDGVKRDRAKPATSPSFPEAEPRSMEDRPTYPGALPPIWNIPHLRNRNFTGRETLLDGLHTALASGEYAALTQVMTGLGGMGKTQLALEYAYRHMDDYKIVWWVQSEEPATLASDYASLADPLELKVRDVRDQRERHKAVRGWLDRHPEWLLIFDNAGKPADLQAYLPQGNTGHVIITSRNQEWSNTAKSLPVKEFKRHESIKFLLERTRETDKDAARSLAESLGDLPLALEQAGAYIDTTSIKLADYLKLFETERERL